MKSEEIISLEMDHLEHSKTDCQIKACQVAKHQLSALITKNLEKVSWKSFSSQQECDKQQPQSPPASHQEENVEEEVNTRNDEGFLEWKNWMERDNLQKVEAASQRQRAKVKTDQWAMMRECTRLMEENKNNWMERKEQEELRRLEDEKNQRIEEGKLKKKQLLKKL